MAQYRSQSSSLSSAGSVDAVEDLIDKATAEHLRGPEWQLNMAVCDMANANHALYVPVLPHVLLSALEGTCYIMLARMLMRPVSCLVLPMYVCMLLSCADI